MSQPLGGLVRPQPPLRRPDAPPTDGVVALDAITEADVPAVVAACDEPVAARWLPLPSPYTADDARDWLALSAEAEERGESLLFAIRDAGDGRYAGSVGLHLDRCRAGEAEMGYLVGAAHRGRGFAAHAVRLLAAWAFAGIIQADGEPWAPRRIELLVQPENVTSRRTCEQAGATFDGVRRAGLWLRTSGAHDAAVYSLLPADVADA